MELSHNEDPLFPTELESHLLFYAKLMKLRYYELCYCKAMSIIWLLGQYNTTKRESSFSAELIDYPVLKSTMYKAYLMPIPWSWPFNIIQKTTVDSLVIFIQFVHLRLANQALSQLSILSHSSALVFSTITLSFRSSHYGFFVNSRGSSF
jgi:hypothetical protein